MPPSTSIRTAHWLPLCVTLITSIGVLVVYIIAVLQKDVKPFLPFISDAAGYLPQSGIFSIVLFYGGMFGYWTVYVRYRAVQDINQYLHPLVNCLNRVAFVIGIISLCGLPILASYPVTTDMMAHNIGANLFFFGCSIYILFQTALSYAMFPNYNGKLICRVRLLISIITLVSLITMITTGNLYLAQHKNDSPGNDVTKKIDHSVPLVTTTSEWILCMGVLSFFFTFVREFRKIYTNIEVRCLVAHFDEELRYDPTASLIRYNSISQESEPLLKETLA